jgi:hypothetical protein
MPIAARVKFIVHCPSTAAFAVSHRAIASSWLVSTGIAQQNGGELEYQGKRPVWRNFRPPGAIILTELGIVAVPGI